MNKTAFSTLKIKSMEDGRKFKGVASTPSTDRQGDIVVPGGAKFSLPIPLLWQHRHNEPIGTVTAARVTSKGIEIDAELVQPTDDMPSQMKARLDEAWHSIKTGLVRGLSIGFRPIKWSYIEDGDGIEFSEWDFYELSAVTIPANADASITNIKKFSEPAVSGADGWDKPLSGTSVKLNNPEKVKNMNYQEMIKRLEATKAEKQAERDAIQKAASDAGRTKDAAEREAFDTLNDEIKALDLELTDLRDLEKQNAATAKPVHQEHAKTAPEAGQYAGIAVHRAPEKLEKGIAFARFAAALGAAKGELSTASAIAQKRFPEDKRLHSVMKAAVDAGTTQDPTWAGNLVEYNEISEDFIDFLRPKTVIGQFGQNGIPALRSIPFNVHVKGQTAAGSAQWVGEGNLKPLTSSGYSDVYLGWAKIAAISVATDELLRFSNPSAERLIRDDLANAVIERMDADFLDITSAAVTNVKPASITNSLTNYGAGTASPEADIAGLWSAADSGNFDLTSAVYITTPAVARKLSGMTTAADNKRFPEMTPRGGSIEGIPVIVSNHADANSFVLVFASEIWLADDGVVTLDASREASLIMADNPQALSDAAADGDAAISDLQAARAVSMFQTNQVAFRAERYINWKPRRANVVSGVLASAWA